MARSLLTLTLCGVLLTLLFWTKLWQGGGFIGGDTYTYFLPQKALLADRLQAGELPFWNFRTGHGYPLIGESQTAVLYPINWLLYGTLDLNTAYVASHLLHYILAFVGMGVLGRRLGLNIWGSLLAAIVYVYGWFPPRACLEWAIIGGVYLPWSLWCLESWFATRRMRYGVGLAILISLDLLAGHFNLAFITTVALGAYAVLRAFCGRSDSSLSPALDAATGRDHPAGERAGVRGPIIGEQAADSIASPPSASARSTTRSGLDPQSVSGATSQPPMANPQSPIPNDKSPPSPQPSPPNHSGECTSAAVGGEGANAVDIGRLRTLLIPLACIVLGYLLAAPQLVPSWSLKRASQRTQANDEFDPGYGHIPPWYLCQMATPWLWFGRDVDPDQVLNSFLIGNFPSMTNKVEAHLYFGIAPLLLTLIWVGRTLLFGEPADPRLRWLGWIGLIAMIYATGWLLPVAKYFPGFAYFRGPGRWGILTTVAVALISGQMLSRWASHKGFGLRCLLTAAVLAATIYDLHWVSRHQWYTFIVSDPPIAHRHESEIGRLLTEYEHEHGPPRMLAPGPNLASLCGHAASPPYLGFGPDAYYLDGGRLPDTRFLQYLSGEATPSDVHTTAQFDWLRAAGVTHILSMKPLPREFPVELAWQGVDRLLNPAWARMSNDQPLYLYSVDGTHGRAFIWDGNGQSTVRTVEYTANRVEVEATLLSREYVVLADLPWPEWELSVDGRVVEDPLASEPKLSTLPGDAATVQRRVPLAAGVHRLVWNYRPRSLWWGCGISAAALIALAGLVKWGRLIGAAGASEMRR